MMPQARTRSAVDAIWIKRVRRGPMDPVDRAELLAGEGIRDDANRGTRRQVTLIARMSWDAVEEELEEPVDPSLRRANVLVSGIDLRESRGRHLILGACRVRVDGETRPCERMDRARPGLRQALATEWRGGVYGVVLEGGTLRVGDAVRFA